MTEITAQDDSLREIMETVWKTLRETSEIQKESSRDSAERKKEFERMKQETEQMRQETEQMRKETERMRQETELQFKETEKLVKEITKSVGGLHNSFGELAEHLVAPGMVKRFNELGYHFDDISPGGRKIIENGIVKAEIDILLENDTTIIAVEVKSRPDGYDLEDHIERLKILSESRRKKNDNRKILGAVAGAVFGSSQKRDVIKTGFFVIEQSGDTMKIDIPKGFVPREW